jgi:mannosyltransferase
LGAQELIDDELCTWWATQISLSEFFALVRKVDAVLAPYYLFMRCWCRIAGDTEWMLRLPSVLATAASAGLLSVLGRKLYDWRAGLAAGLCFAVIPAVVRFSQDARPYALATLCATAATLALVHAVEKPRATRRWGYYAIGVLLTGLMHLVSLCVLAAHFAFLFEGRRAWSGLKLHRGTLGRWSFAVTLALLGVLPIVLAGAHQEEQLRRVELLPHMLLTLPSTVALSSRVGYTLLCLAAVSIARRATWSIALVVWAVLPGVFLFATYDILHIFRARYLLFTLPAWALLAGVACGHVRWLARWPLLVATVAVAALWVYEPLERVWHRQEPESSLYGCPSRILARLARPTDVLIHGGSVADKGHTRIGLAYGLRQSVQPRDALVQRSAASLGSFRAKECNPRASCLPADSQRIWFIFPNSKDGPMDRATARLEAELEPLFQRENSWFCAARRLDLLVRRSAGSP